MGKESGDGDSPRTSSSGESPSVHKYKPTGPGKLKSSLSRAFLAVGMPVTFKVGALD